jgi:hypothetical protein
MWLLAELSVSFLAGIKDVAPKELVLNGVLGLRHWYGSVCISLRSFAAIPTLVLVFASFRDIFLFALRVVLNGTSLTHYECAFGLRAAT